MKKVKIQIELRPLANGNDTVKEYPEEAIKCSSLALHTLLYLVGQVEEKRNTCTIVYHQYSFTLFIHSHHLFLSYRCRQTARCLAFLAHIRIRGPFLVLDQHATHFRQSTRSKENPRCTALAERNLGYVVLECRLVMSIHLRAHHEFFLASSLLMSPSKCRTTFSLINTHPCSPQIES